MTWAGPAVFLELEHWREPLEEIQTTTYGNPAHLPAWLPGSPQAPPTGGQVVVVLAPRPPVTVDPRGRT